jgi:uncharacterized phage protein gp47/JayE
MINLFSQSKADTLDAIAQVFNSFDPDVAMGNVLVKRCAINGIQKKGASYTYTPVTVTVDRTTSLIGLDTSDTAMFTVADTNGNKYYLVSSITILSGSTSLSFRAANAGRLEPILNTITSIVTIVLGVTAVNNPDSASNIGIDEETDPALRIRRRQSVALASKGYLEGLLGELENIADVEYAQVYENNTSSTDGDGIPAHSIWAIVEGGVNNDIAKAIYVKRNGGCGMRGSVEVNIVQVNGTIFPVYFDRTIHENLYILLRISSKDPLHTIDDTWLKQQIFDHFDYGINKPADISSIIAYVIGLDANIVGLDGSGVSDHAGDYVAFLYPGTIQKRWITSLSRIVIEVI